MTTTSLLLGVLFGSIGFGYFLYGKKQKVTVPLISGIVLMVFPYFIENIILLSVIGIIFSILPMLLRR